MNMDQFFYDGARAYLQEAIEKGYEEDDPEVLDRMEEDRYDPPIHHIQRVDNILLLRQGVNTLHTVAVCAFKEEGLRREYHRVVWAMEYYDDGDRVTPPDHGIEVQIFKTLDEFKRAVLTRGFRYKWDYPKVPHWAAAIFPNET
jgi:hypothetical protein